MSKKAALFTPYADTLGGGERYLFTLAQVLLEEDWQVTVNLPDDELLVKVQERFNLSLPGIERVEENLFTGKPIQKLTRHRRFDLLFWVSDGSIPLMLAKKNWLHFQVPFHGLQQNKISNYLKLLFIDRVVCNSRFTKKIVDKEYGFASKSEVWYPPVAVADFTPAPQKENTVVAVGRFSQVMNVKRQDILIRAFRQLVDSGLSDWKLVLVGGSRPHNSYLAKLKEQAVGYPIEFKVNAPFQQLKQAYAQAKIFWHAAGYGIDETKQPEKVEHFGMTTIEAMAAGCFPLVYAAGGQKEIFRDTDLTKKSLWQTVEQLMAKTRIAQSASVDQNHLIKLAQRYSVDNFKKQVRQCL